AFRLTLLTVMLVRSVQADLDAAWAWLLACGGPQRVVKRRWIGVPNLDIGQASACLARLLDDPSAALAFFVALCCRTSWALVRCRHLPARSHSWSGLMS